MLHILNAGINPSQWFSHQPLVSQNQLPLLTGPADCIFCSPESSVHFQLTPSTIYHYLLNMWIQWIFFMYHYSYNRWTKWPWLGEPCCKQRDGHSLRLQQKQDVHGPENIIGCLQSSSAQPEEPSSPNHTNRTPGSSAIRATCGTSRGVTGFLHFIIKRGVSKGIRGGSGLFCSSQVLGSGSSRSPPATSGLLRAVAGGG